MSPKDPKLWQERLHLREKWARKVGRAFPLTHQCGSTGHKGKSNPISPTKASAQHSDRRFVYVHWCPLWKREAVAAIHVYLPRNRPRDGVRHA